MRRDIKSLLADYPYDDRTAVSATVVHGLSYHSGWVRPGDLFFCLRGVREDGHLHAPGAVAKGAAALVVEEWLPAVPAPQVRVANSRKALAAAARAFYGNPAASLGLVGVTGTNGKTTVSFMVRAILEQAGRQTGLIGTVHNVLGSGVQEPATLTTPESADLQRLLKRALDGGCSWVVMEVSSHALAQERVDPRDFDLALLLNIKRDHFEYHGTFERYLAAKMRLAQELSPESRGGRPKAVIIAADDEALMGAADSVQAPIVTFGIRNRADVSASHIEEHPGGTRFDLALPGTAPFAVDLRLAGRFNVYNALAAAAAAWRMGIQPAAIQGGLQACTRVPGRAEPVEAGQPFRVIVDFAHNPEAIANIVTLRPESGRTILVFGAEGEKDPGKRPHMGAAARGADYLIITSDNTYGEDPAVIAAQVAEGVGDRAHEIILDRRLAIERAVEIAQPGDLLIIAGKGHEQTWDWRGVKLPHDDRQAVRAAIARKFAVSQQ